MLHLDDVALGGFESVDVDVGAHGSNGAVAPSSEGADLFVEVIEADVEQLADDSQRKRFGERGDEVVAAVGGPSVDEVIADRSDRRRERADP